MPNIIFITDSPSVSAKKQNQYFSWSELQLIQEFTAEAGIYIETVEYKSILPYTPSKTDRVWTTEKKIATQYGYASNECDKAYYDPSILAYFAQFQQAITKHKPSILVPLTDMALWLLTGETSIYKYRGSEERTCFPTEHLVIPTFSPKQLFRMPDWKIFARADYRRMKAAQNVKLQFPEQDLTWLIRPTFQQIKECLQKLLTFPKDTLISVDIETIRRHISCIGIAWNPTAAICIPFVKELAQNYFTLDEEVEIVDLISQVLRHCKIIGQNYSYDTQHIVRSWGVLKGASIDTTLLSHAIFPGVKKDLSVLASMYCERYTYWKDENNDFNNLPQDLDQSWLYNVKDCVYTFEIALRLIKRVREEDKYEQWKFLQRVQHNVNRMMLRGIRVDKEEKSQLRELLSGELAKRQKTLNLMTDAELNINSPKQMQQFFYTSLGLPVVKSKKTRTVSTDEASLQTVAQREPIVKPIVDLITNMRSIKVFLSTFVMMALDHDGRMRTSYNVGGPETYRFASSKDPFGSGGNLQNIPKGQEKENVDQEIFTLPNLRKMFIPDSGKTLFDVDLSGADAQVVAWESEDEDLKAKFRSGEKIHALNAKDIYGRDAGPDGKREPYYKRSKMGTHLSNYGGTPRTLSQACGITVHEAELFQKRWFDMHPGIKHIWHERIWDQLYTNGIIENRFGFRRVYFSDPQQVFTEALAWIPQSTVAIVINKALCRLEELQEFEKTPIELMLQVHDSLVGQIPRTHKYKLFPIIREMLKVPVPYNDPLLIGTSLDISEKSWGDLISCQWDDYCDE